MPGSATCDTAAAAALTPRWRQQQASAPLGVWLLVLVLVLARWAALACTPCSWLPSVIQPASVLCWRPKSSAARSEPHRVSTTTLISPRAWMDRAHTRGNPGK